MWRAGLDLRRVPSNMEQVDDVAIVSTVWLING